MIKDIRYWTGTLLLVLALVYLAVDIPTTVWLAYSHRITPVKAYGEEVADGFYGYALHTWLIRRSDRRRAGIRKQDHQ